MATNQRIIYNALGLYASQTQFATGAQTGVGTIKQLTRVQSFNDDFSRNLTNINQYGNLASIDRLDVQTPTVNASFSYYATDGGNENAIGLFVSTGAQSLISCLSGILSKATDEKNYYLLIVGDGQDASQYSGPTSGIVAVGNANLTNYSLKLAVGAIPVADCSIECLNWKSFNDADGTNDVPAINTTNGVAVTGTPFVLPQLQTNAYSSQPTALLAGDALVSITGNLGFGINDISLQSTTISFDLGRTPINKIGSRFAVSREINFPVTAKMSIDGILKNVTDANLVDLLCQTGTYNLQMTLKKNDCSGNGAPAFIVKFLGAKLLSQNFTSSIGSDVTIQAVWESQLAASNDLLNGIQMSGTFQ